MADQDNLFPEDYEDETVDPDEIEEDEPIGYRPGVAFDWATGDFVRDGRNNLMEATGVDSWKQWCINCIQTERYKHLAYSEDYGIEIEEAFKATTREEAESILTRQIVEALEADPYGRTAYVDSITFNWTQPDAVQVDLTVVGIADVTIDITTFITNGGES